MTGREGPSVVDKLAALALLAAVLTLIAAFVVWPAERRAARLDAEIETARALAAGYAVSLRAGRPEAPEALEEPSFGDEWAQGETPAIAAAGLRRRIAAVAEAEGAEIRSAQDLPQPADASIGIVALRVVLEGANESALRTLHRIETERPFLTVDRLSVRATDGGERLVMELDVSGLMAPEPAE